MRKALDDQDEAKKRAEQQRKVLVFTLVMGILVAVGALGGLFLGLLIDGGSLESNPALPIGHSVLGLSLSLVAADRLARKLLANWIA
jgi:hypothetical protein